MNRPSLQLGVFGALLIVAQVILASDVMLYVGVKSGDVRKVKAAIYEDANVNMEVNGQKLLVEAIDRVLALYPLQDDTIAEKAWVHLNSLIGSDLGLLHAAAATTALGCSVSLVRRHAVETLLSAAAFTSLVLLRRQTTKQHRLEVVELLAMHLKLSRESLLAAIGHVRDRLVKAYEQRTETSEALLEIDTILRRAAAQADAREYRRIRQRDEAV